MSFNLVTALVFSPDSPPLGDGKEISKCLVVFNFAHWPFQYCNLPDPEKELTQPEPGVDFRTPPASSLNMP